jgi:hypothetical protein
MVSILIKFAFPSIEDIDAPSLTGIEVYLHRWPGESSVG